MVSAVLEDAWTAGAAGTVDAAGRRVAENWNGKIRGLGICCARCLSPGRG